jgi:hypothetical protein
MGMNHEQPSLRDAGERYAGRVTEEVRSVFGDRVVGVWLIGSLAQGGFGPTSDIDIQAAVVQPTGEEIEDLVPRIRHPTPPCPAAGLEFVLYDVAVLTTPTPPLQWSLNLNGGPNRAEKISMDPASESWHWFVLDLAAGRQTARTLHGAALRDVVGPIGRDDQRAAIAASVRWHSRHDEGGANQAANAARGLLLLRTGRWTSKPDAIGWASARGYSAGDVMAELAAELGDEVDGIGP